MEMAAVMLVAQPCDQAVERRADIHGVVLSIITYGVNICPKERIAIIQQPPEYLFEPIIAENAGHNAFSLAGLLVFWRVFIGVWIGV